MKKFISILLIVVFIASLALVNNVEASKETTGLISSNTTWTKVNGPYTLTGPVCIVRGVTLTIEPGVIVNFNNNAMEINGTLIAKGDRTDLIDFNDAYLYFMPLTPSQQQASTDSEIEFVDFTPQPLDMPQAIYIDSTSPKIINNIIHGYITVEGNSAPIISENNFIAGGIQDSANVGHTISNNVLSQTRLKWSSGAPVIVVDATYAVSSVAITNNTVSGGSIGIRGSGNITNNHVSDSLEGIGGWDISTIITDNVLVRCDVGVAGECVIQKNFISGNGKGDGISTNGNATIVNNTITGNKNGIHTQKADANSWQGALPETLIAKYNNIYGNTEYNIRLDSFDNANATYNWWGATDQQAINSSIYDFENDFTLGTVTYMPFLIAANPQAMPDSNAPLPTPAQTPAATTSQTSTTPSSSTSPSQNPTATPSQLGAGTSMLFGWSSVEISIAVLLVVVVVLLVFVVVYLRRRTVG